MQCTLTLLSFDKRTSVIAVAAKLCAVAAKLWRIIKAEQIPTISARFFRRRRDAQRRHRASKQMSSLIYLTKSFGNRTDALTFEVRSRSLECVGLALYQASHAFRV